MDWSHPLAHKFKEAMDDDFNTPEAISILFDLANEINKSKSAPLADLLRALAKTIGLLERDPERRYQHGLFPLGEARW